jgi:hypothetical protein
VQRYFRLLLYRISIIQNSGQPENPVARSKSTIRRPVDSGEAFLVYLTTLYRYTGNIASNGNYKGDYEL